MSRTVTFLVLLALAAALGVACSNGKVSCSLSNCAGCCDAQGTCQPGAATSACGTSGAACAPCPAGQVCALGACAAGTGGAGGAGGAGGTGGTGGGSITCTPCVGPADCPGGACVQVAGADVCGATCAGPADCAATENCDPAVASDGTQVRVCVPKNGSCGGAMCPPTCPAGTQCDPVTAQCVAVVDAGVQQCGVYDGPGLASCCHSCSPPNTGTCQANGCYGGWWCDRTACRCASPPTSCGPVDAGPPPPPPDGGGLVVVDAGISGSVGPDGGTVSRLFFAVVGDTRPAVIDDTARYPSTVITGIYSAIAAMNPLPQFVVTTGDYMFASTTGSQAAPQLDLYMAARGRYPGTLFPAIGNHECTGATASNCAATQTSNYREYMSRLVAPIGRTLPYYAFDVAGVNRVWTAKFIVAACNAWDATQLAWLQAQLARGTTYTFVIRHEALGVAAPCTTDMDAVLRATPPTMLLVGHTHTYSHSGYQLVEGVGGAPITGSAVYGYATIEQLTTGQLRVTQYDSASHAAVSTYTVP